ncbi:3-oxo-5-alpha-steroid 4-dehydrogenase 2-like [Hibiscus syriacus]|uniref:3-oxo-5-alpha-steroid 4-dehydrogenase 2-like n=1 Tax=Hibiscus syriacus TaxID=106335 RepID=UPI0019230051|nr:3-oxo-5-alpha-steroid 4-dehydrogenase 2-like [Hibiscus syriacus]
MALLKFLFPPSLFVTATSLASFTALASAGLSEFRGKNAEYSKFFNIRSNASDSEKSSKFTLPSRIAMATLYTPAFLAGISSFAIFPEENLRFLLLKSAISIHFFKRVLESCFVHKYSGEMGIDTMIIILSSYFISTALMIFNQHLTIGLPEPAIDLKTPGILLFFLGISGNFYHHLLLSKLRTEGPNKEYKIPKGGLFGVVVFPHYLFEVLIFWGFAFISQTLFSFAYAMATTCYLLGRSYASRRWYLSKFKDFPRNVKSMIPFLF